MKIEGFHKLSLRFFRLAVSLISSQLVLELYSSRILFYYEMKIGEWFHEFKIFWLAVSFVLLPSWVLSCMRWKLEMIPRVKFKIFRWTGSVHSSWRKIGRFQELNLRFLDWQWVWLILNIMMYHSWILYEMKIVGQFHEFKIFRLAVSFVLFPSWISYTKWKLEDSTSWV